MRMRLSATKNWIVAAVRRGEKAWVPGAEDALEVGDTALLIGRHGTEAELRGLFLGDRS